MRGAHERLGVEGQRAGAFAGQVGDEDLQGPGRQAQQQAAAVSAQHAGLQVRRAGEHGRRGQRRVGERGEQPRQVSRRGAVREHERDADAAGGAACPVAAQRAERELACQRVPGGPGAGEVPPLGGQPGADRAEPPQFQRPGLPVPELPGRGRVGDQVEQPVGVLARCGAAGPRAGGVLGSQHQQCVDQRYLQGRVAVVGLPQRPRRGGQQPVGLRADPHGRVGALGEQRRAGPAGRLPAAGDVEHLTGRESPQGRPQGGDQRGGGRAVSLAAAGQVAQPGRIAGQRPRDIQVAVAGGAVQDGPPRGGVGGQRGRGRGVDAVGGHARFEQAGPAIGGQASEQLAGVAVAKAGDVQRVDGRGEARGGDDPGDADLDRLVPVLPPAPVTGQVGVGEVGQQPAAVHGQRQHLVQPRAVGSPHHQLGRETGDAGQRRGGALLGRGRCPDGEGAVRGGGDERAVQVDRARRAYLGGQVTPCGGHAGWGAGGSGGVAPQRVQFAGGDPGVVADEPRLVGDHPQPQVAVLEPGLDADGQQHTQVGGHGWPPACSESPLIRTRTGWASVAAAHSCPVLAPVGMSLRNR